MIAGLLGVASGVFLAFVSPAVPDTRYSYPLTSSAFAAIQAWFFLQHLGLLGGQIALWQSGAARVWKPAMWGHVLGAGGMLSLAATELLAISAASSPYPSPRTDVLDILYGVSSVAIGVGLTLVGIGVLRTRAWSGLRRWLPLALGIYVFVPMTPAIATGFVAARLSISGWMLLYAGLGWALVRVRPEDHHNTATATVDSVRP